METNKKREVAEALVKYAKSEISVSNLNVKDEKIGYIIEGNLFNGTDVEFTIRKNGDFGTCKLSCKLISDGENELNNIAKEMVGDNDINYTTYDEKYVFQKVVRFVDQDDATAEETLKEAFKTIIDMVRDNQKYIEINYVVNQADDNTEPISSPMEEQTTGEAAENSDTSIENITKEETIEESVVSENIEENSMQSDDTDDIIDVLTTIESDNTPEPEENKFIKKERKRRVKLGNNNQKEDRKESNNNINPSTSMQDNSGDMEQKATIEENEAPEKAPSSSEVPKSVSEQIDEMYADLSRIFDEKQKENDLREKNLDKYADTLKEKELQIEEKKKEDEKEIVRKGIELENKYKQKEADLANDYNNRLKELETEYIEKKTELEKIEEAVDKQRDENTLLQKKLDFEKKKLDSEVKSIESKKKMLDEKIALNEKSVTITPAPVTSDNKEDDKKDNGEYQKLLEEYNSLVDENNELADENDELTEEIESYKTKLEKLSNSFKSMQSKADKSEQMVKTLQKQLEEKTEEVVPVATENTAEIEELKEKIEHLEKERDMYKDTSEKLREKESAFNNEMDILRNNSDAKDAEIFKLKEELNNTKDSNIPVKEDISVKANRIKDDLAKLGVNLEIVASAGEVILSARQDDCLYVINVECDVLYVEKDVKKPVKYNKLLAQWNLEDIRVSFVVSGQKIICKYAYSDVMRATKEIMDKYATLN